MRSASGSPGVSWLASILVIGSGIALLLVLASYLHRPWPVGFAMVAIAPIVGRGLDYAAALAALSVAYAALGIVWGDQLMPYFACLGLAWAGWNGWRIWRDRAKPGRLT